MVFVLLRRSSRDSGGRRPWRLGLRRLAHVRARTSVPFLALQAHPDTLPLATLSVSRPPAGRQLRARPGDTARFTPHSKPTHTHASQLPRYPHPPHQLHGTGDMASPATRQPGWAAAGSKQPPSTCAPPSPAPAGGRRPTPTAATPTTPLLHGGLLAAAVCQALSLRSAAAGRLLPLVHDHKSALQSTAGQAVARHRQWPQCHPVGVGRAVARAHWRALLHHCTLPPALVLQDLADIMFYTKASLAQEGDPLRGFELPLQVAASGVRRIVSALYSACDFRRGEAAYHWVSPLAWEDCVGIAEGIFAEAKVQPVPDHTLVRHMPPGVLGPVRSQAAAAVAASSGRGAEIASAPSTPASTETATVKEDTYVSDGLRPMRMAATPGWLQGTLAGLSLAGRVTAVAAGFTSVFLDVGGALPARLHAYDSHPACTRGAPPIVLVHGILTTGLCMAPLAAVVSAATGRRVLCPDLPDFEYGFSSSHRAAGGGPASSWDDKITIIGALCRQLAQTYGGRGVDLVGHSYGGYIVEGVAATCPDAVRKVVSIAPAGAHRYRNFFPVAALASRAFSLARLGDSGMPQWVAAATTGLVRSVAQSPSVLCLMLTQFLGKYLAARGGGLSHETLMIVPEYDNLHMPYFRPGHPLGDALIMRDVRKGRGLWCSGVSHGCVVEAPAALGAEIAAFCGTYTWQGEELSTPWSAGTLHLHATAATLRTAAVVTERAVRLTPMRPDPAALQTLRADADAAWPLLQANFGAFYEGQLPSDTQGSCQGALFAEGKL